jgi:16S rRNA (uracil1498-N3)-methyltransferase
VIRLLHPVPPEGAESVSVEGARFHHAVHVLRLKVGDALEVFDGAGRAFPARVVSIGAESAQLSLGHAVERAPARSITLIQGLPKGDKLESILQHGTELGAAAFAPVETARCVAQVKADRVDAKLQRWTRIVEEAARQCGRSDLPAVLPPRPLLAAVRALPASTRVLVLDEEERMLSLAQAFPRESGEPVALVVGPEGGLDRAEVAALQAGGAVAVTLGTRILRTETASLAALAVLLHLDGQFG